MLLLKRISQAKRFSSHKEKVCFHINKIFSRIQKSISLHLQKTNGKFMWQILAAISHVKILRQIPMASSCDKFSRQIFTARWCGIILLCERASRMKIKRKEVRKQRFIKSYKTIASEMVKTRGLISKTNISNISGISFSWKWLTLIVFAVSIIQLPSRKGTDMDLMCI